MIWRILPPSTLAEATPGQPLELGLDRVVGEVVELLLVEPAARDRHEADRDVRQVELEDERLLDAGGQRVHDLLDALDDLGEARVEVGAPGELHVDRARSPGASATRRSATLATAETAFSMG